jgi:hypothetical protein
MLFLMNLQPEMKVASHLRISAGSWRPHEAHAEARGHSGGLRTVEVMNGDEWSQPPQPSDR